MARPTAGGLQAVLTMLVVLLVGIGVAACGSSGSSDAANSIGKKGHSPIVSNAHNARVTLTVGSESFPEQEILGEIYAQTLRAAGYRVKKDSNLGAGAAAREALRSGGISGYPGYLSTVLSSLFGVKLRDVPGKAGEAFRSARADFEEEGLTAFPPTPFARAYVLATLRETNEENHWGNLFGMEGESEGLTIYGPPGCRKRRDCLAGLRKNYALIFKSFTPVDPRRRYKVLESGQADVSFVTTTDAQLAGEGDKFMSLVDDKRALPAGNVVFVTTLEAVEEAGPGYEKSITEVQKGLTLPVMQELNARVELEGQSPAKVAAAYLEEAGYTG